MNVFIIEAGMATVIGRRFRVEPLLVEIKNRLKILNCLPFENGELKKEHIKLILSEK